MRPIHGNWKVLPGNWDPLRALESFPSSDDWGIPTIPSPDLPAIPEWGVCCDDWSRFSKSGKLRSDGLGICHFFTDDYRFEACWNNPDRQLARLHDATVMSSPDFSLYRDHPRAIQLWNTYRNRWVGRRFAEFGRIVIPTISWSDESSYEYCFRGVDPGSVVIVSTVGTQGADPEASRLFLAGYQEMCRILEPRLVLVYGEKIPMEILTIADIKQIIPYQVQLAARCWPAPSYYEP